MTDRCPQAAQGFKEGEAATVGTVYRFRLARAAMNTRYVILLRWAEVRSDDHTHCTDSDIMT